MSRHSSRLVALWCWYHGAGFKGYQAQAKGPTVQETLMNAFRKVGLSRNPVASGRTDAGVHARMQVLSLRVVEPLALDALPQLLNAQLPPTVGISLAKQAPPHFNAHWRATVKEYRYRLSRQADARWASAGWEQPKLDLAVLRETLSCAVGEHDFYAFHDKSSSVRLRTIHSIAVVEQEGRVDIRLRGAGFGRYMVRYLVGGAVAAATGQWSVGGFRRALELGSRGERPDELIRAPAKGLVLWSVDYPPDEDPFTSDERRTAPGLPPHPPFC